MKQEKFHNLLEATDFKELKSTLFQISIRDAMKNPDVWEETEMIEDVSEIYNLLEVLHELPKPTEIKHVEKQNDLSWLANIQCSESNEELLYILWEATKNHSACLNDIRKALEFMLENTTGTVSVKDYIQTIAQLSDKGIKGKTAGELILSSTLESTMKKLGLWMQSN